MAFKRRGEMLAMGFTDEDLKKFRDDPGKTHYVRPKGVGAFRIQGNCAAVTTMAIRVASRDGRHLYEVF